jgi:hypothetical protein
VVRESTTPDWDYWLDCIAWRLCDAVCLSLNLEPRNQAVIDQFNAYKPFTRYRSRTPTSLHDRLQQAYDALDPRLTVSGRILEVSWESEWRPYDFAAWAEQMGWKVPPHFDLILEVGRPTPTVRTPTVISTGTAGVLQASAVETVVTAAKTDGDATARRSAATAKEFSTLLKLVIGMAAVGYKWKSDVKRSDITPEITRDVQSLGLDIDDDTVRKWLRLAAKMHLDKKPS